MKGKKVYLLRKANWIYLRLNDDDDDDNDDDDD